MNYIGSKKKLLPFIELAVKYCDLKKENPVFCDLFAGTGIVGRYFKEKGYKIIANDLEFYSYSLINHYIKNHKFIDIEKFLNELNTLKGINTGFIYNNYAPSGKFSLLENNTRRKYFTDENAKIIDEARLTIDFWKKSKAISEEEYNYLLAIIIEAADRVANTASVYGAYLKNFKKTALNKIYFEPLEYSFTNYSHTTFNEDANELIKYIKGDILYLDPPYNNRQYGSNYHILNTIAKNDNPDIKGVTGMRNYETSNWCKKSIIEKEFEDLIKNAKFDYILFSYNSESIMSEDIIKSIMSKYGEYTNIQQDYQRFKSDKEYNNRKYSNDRVIEYIHILKKVKK